MGGEYNGQYSGCYSQILKSFILGRNKVILCIQSQGSAWLSKSCADVQLLNVLGFFNDVVKGSRIKE